MGADNGAVDQRLLVVGLIRQMVEDPLPHAAPGPAAEPGVDLLTVAEPLWQIPPGNAGAVSIEHGLDKQPVVLGRHPDMLLATGQEVLDPFPLVITQGIAAHRSAPPGGCKPGSTAHRPA